MHDVGNIGLRVTAFFEDGGDLPQVGNGVEIGGALFLAVAAVQVGADGGVVELPVSWQTWSMWSTTVSSVMPALSIAVRSHKGETIQMSMAVPMTPPRWASALICRSSSWRSWSHKARQQLCVASTGPVKISIASQNACSAKWLTSRIIPAASSASSMGPPLAVRPPGAWVPCE